MPEKEDLVRFYRIKDEVRILGIDDAPFTPRKKGWVMIVGAVFRGGSFMDGVLRSEVEIDGIDSTEKVTEMVNSTKFRDIRVIMLNGLGFAGFNLVDIEELYKKTKLPVIAVVRNMPDFESIYSAIKTLPNRGFYEKCIEKAGKPRKVETKPGKHVYIQHKGISFEDAREIVQLASTRSLIPEPIRVAHLIAQGITLGESRGHA